MSKKIYILYRIFYSSLRKTKTPLQNRSSRNTSKKATHIMPVQGWHYELVQSCFALLKDHVVLFPGCGTMASSTLSILAQFWRSALVLPWTLRPRKRPLESSECEHACCEESQLFKTVLISIFLPILDEVLYNRVVSLWCVYFAVMVIIVVDELDYLYRCLAMLN